MSLSQTILLIKGTKHNSHSYLRSRFQCPDCLHNYSNKPIIFSHRNQESLHPLNTKAYLTPSWLFTLFLSTACIGSSSPRLWIYMTNKLLSISSYQTLSSVRCHVFSHRHNLRLGIPPLPIKTHPITNITFLSLLKGGFNYRADEASGLYMSCVHADFHWVAMRVVLFHHCALGSIAVVSGIIITSGRGICICILFVPTPDYLGSMVYLNYSLPFLRSFQSLPCTPLRAWEVLRCHSGPFAGALLFTIASLSF